MANAVTAETLNDKPIASYDDFLSLFHAALKPASEFRVGAEMEKFGVYEDGTPIPYEGDSGVRAILEELAKKGWKPEAETEGGPLIDLQPCGGTHVAHTAEIGAVAVTKVEKKSANTRRVVLSFVA